MTQTGPTDRAGQARRLMLVILAAAVLLGGCLQSAEDQCFTFDNTNDANASSVCTGGESSSSDSTTASVTIARVSSNDEVVLIVNTSSSDEDMTGWTLENTASGSTDDKFTFPSFILSAGDFVRVHTADGDDDTDDLYWGGSNHWETTSTAALKDETGQTIDTCANTEACYD